MRTVLTVLFSYSTLAQLPGGYKQVVWSIDPSVPLFGLKFASLFIICLLLFLFLVPFNVILLFVRYLSRFKVVNHFKPFLDAFQGAYKNKYHFWLGTQISLRSLLFVFYSFHTQMKLIMSTLVLFFFSICFGYAYPNRNKFVNIHELTLLLNLTIIYAMSYQSSNEIFSAVTNILIAIALTQSCLVIFVHIFVYIFHYDFIAILKVCVANKLERFNKTSRSTSQYASLNIPDLAFNYTEYRDGLVSDDFRHNIIEQEL